MIMRKLLLNPTPLYRKLRELSLLLTLLLMPIGVWAENYPILVGNTRLTSENIGNYPISWDAISRTITLTNANLTETITWDGHKDDYGLSLTIKLKGVNKISTGNQFCLIEDRDKTNSGNGYELTFVAADDDSELTMECNKISGDVRTIDGFNNMTDPKLIYLHQTLTSASEKCTMKLVRYYGMYVAGHPVTKDNKSEIKGEGISGKAMFDSNVLTLEGATLTSGIFWESEEDLTISLKGKNSITTEDGSCIYCPAPVSPSYTRSRASTRGAAPGIIFYKGDDVCSFSLSCQSGSNVIENFNNSTEPALTGDGLKWIVEEKSNNDIIKASVAVIYPLKIGTIVVSSTNYSPIKNSGGNSIGASYDNASHTLTLDGATLTSNIKWEADANLTVEIKGENNSITPVGPCFTSDFDKEITFKRGDADNLCKLVLNCNKGTDVFDNFSYTPNPAETGLVWIPTVDDLGSTSSATILSGAKKVSITCVSPKGEFLAVEGTYSMEYDGDYYVLPNTVFTLSVFPNEGYKPAFSLSDNTITVTATEKKEDGVYKSTEFSFTMPDDDVTATLTFPIDLANTSVTATIEDAVYTGSAIIPTTVHVTGIPGETGTADLKSGTHFTITGYQLNGTDVDSPIDVGTYTVTIEGKGDYIGTKKVEYKILNTYALWINGTQVNDKNAANIFAGDATNNGKVSFTAATDTDPTNTLKLNGFINNGFTAPIKSGLDNLTIEFSGSNTISGCGYITSTNPDATLTFTAGNANSSLELLNTSGEKKAAIEGFKDVKYKETYLKNYFACGYIPGDNAAIRNAKGGIVNSCIITTAKHYPLWVRNIQVTQDNKGNVLSDNTVTFDDKSNTLTLNDAAILHSRAIESFLDKLVITLKGNNRINGYHDGFGSICSGVGTATLTIAKDATASGDVSLELEAGGVPVISGFKTVSHEGLNFMSKTGATLDAAQTLDASLSTVKLYPLWIGGEMVTESNKTFNGSKSGTATFSESDGKSTLTLNNYSSTFNSINAIETGIENLKIVLASKNIISCNGDVYIFKSIRDNASIQFVRDGDNDYLKLETTKPDGLFGDFDDGEISYDGLICFQSGDNEWAIKQPAKPVLSWRVDDTDHYTYATLSNADEAEFYTASPKYSFVYADEQQEVKNQVFPEDGIKMTGPGVLTAWVEVDGIKSEEVTGVRFGLTESPVTTVYEGTAKTISLDLQPEDKLTGFTVTLDSKPEFVSFDSEKKELTVNGCGKGEFSLKFTNTAAVAAPEFVVLGDTAKYQIEVIPAKPIISLASGEYDETKTVALSSTVNGASIKFYLGNTAPETPQTYTAPINITKSTKLTAWVVSNDMKSQTETATYTIYQIFVNPYKDSQIWACFFSTEDDMTLPDNLEAYFITDIGETALSITQLDYLPKKVPVLIKKTGDLTGAKYTEYTGNPSTVSFENIILKYATDPIGATGKQYVLFNNEFVKATGSIPAGRCYIELDSNSGNVHARSLSIGDGETTRIVSMDIMENEAGAQWYDLQGRRIQKPAKSGLYIVKGKLVMYNNK